MLQYRYIIIIVATMMTLYSSAFGGLVINEAMVNEPGGATSLEWVELYNDAATPTASLKNYDLWIGTTPIRFDEIDFALQPGEYFIVCRSLYAAGISPAFESYWGDSSGFWGDTEYEASLRTPYDIPFSLPNQQGIIVLFDGWGQTISEFSWDETSADGYSWERRSPGSGTIYQSIDFEGSTPGFVNSLTSVGYDLALEEVQVSPADGDTRLGFTLTNRGQVVVQNATISLQQILANGFGVPIGSIDVPDLDPGYSLFLVETFAFDGLYVDVEATVPTDDRDRNNLLTFVATGDDYPPLIVTEVMADPAGGLASEWVEIYNRYTGPINLKNWLIGDELGLSTISNSDLMIDPGDYLVLAEDALLFTGYYSYATGDLIEPTGWRTLNNDGDLVRLIDTFGIEADRFVYDDGFGDNYTWGRSTDLIDEDVWGRSLYVDGTPGEENEIVVQPNDSGLKVTITPDHFAPDGDGIDETTAITIEAPETDEYRIKIFDREGRLVRTLADNESWLRPVYYWDGRSESGNRLPLGIYILYVEAVGIESIKKPIVIVR